MQTQTKHLLCSYLLTILFIFNRVHGTAWSGCQRVVKLSIFAKTAGIAQEWISLVIVYGPTKNKPCILLQNNIGLRMDPNTSTFAIHLSTVTY